jgi:hypothetical protein
LKPDRRRIVLVIYIPALWGSSRDPSANLDASAT